MVLNGTTFQARYDSRIHNLVSLKNVLTHDEYIKRTPLVPIMSLTLSREGTGEYIEAVPIDDKIVLTADASRATILYHGFGGFEVDVAVTIEAQGETLVFSALITNRQAGMEIVEVLFPHISGIFLGDSYADDTIIYPHHAGERTLNPVKMYGHDAKDFWRAASKPYGSIYRREINYCGLASMSWMYYQDPGHGLYFGSHDPRFPVTGVIAETGTEDDPYMGFGFRKHHRIALGQTYGTGQYLCAVSDQDWHHGARIYRDYILPLLDIQRQPQFLSAESALNQCYNFKKEGVVHHRFSDIPAMFDAGVAWGVRHMFIASWNRSGFDSCYPEYYPDMELGSAMELRRGLEYVRSKGGFTTMYINARIFDVKSDFHRSVGEQMALRDKSGGMVYETYGPEKFTVNCPSDNLWQEYLIDTAEFTVKAYGAHGIYLDQLASAEPFACHSRTHSHADIGDFNNGYLHVVKEIHRRLQAHDPDSYIMTENCGDIYASYVWANLTWNGADYDEYFNVFKYTFPEFTHVNMVNPRAWEKNPDKRHNWFYQDVQRALLLGSVFWIGITSRFTDAASVQYGYMRKALSLRQRLQPYFSQAKFLDTTYIAHITQGCDATSWELPDGRIMVLAGNTDLNGAASLKVVLPRPVDSIEYVDMEHSPVIDKGAGTELHLDIGKSRLTCHLITLHP